MTPFPFSVRAVLDGFDSNCRWRFYAKTNFPESDEWVEFAVEPGWTIENRVNQARILKCNPVNIALSYSAETNPENRMQLEGLVKVTAEVVAEDVTYTEVNFLGRIEEVDPSEIEFGLTAYDMLADLVTTQSKISEEADRIDLGDGIALEPVVGDGYSNVYGVSTATAAAFMAGDTSKPRRTWAPSGVTLYDGDGKPVESTKYQILDDLGLLQILDTNLSGPYEMDGVEVYQEGTLDLSDPLKAIIEFPAHTDGNPQLSGGLGLTSAAWTIVRACDSGSTDTVIVVKGGCRHLYPYHNVTIDGETRRIASRSLSAGTITLDSALTGAPAEDEPISYDSLNVGIDISKAVWSFRDGSNMDFYKRVLKDLNESVVLLYNAEHEVYELLRYQQADNSEYTLPHSSKTVASQTRERREIYTRFVGTGLIEQPVNQCTIDTLETLPIPPSGENTKVYRNGKVEFGGAEEPELWFDGKFNTAFGWHYTSLDLTQYYPMASWDFTAVKRWGKIFIVAPPTQFAGPQGAYMMYGYTLEGSQDGSNWFVISPALQRRLILPSLSVVVERADILRPDFRYMRLSCKPAKDGKFNYDDPYLGLGEIGLFEDVVYEAIAQLQNTNPSGAVTVRVPYGPDWSKEISTYDEGLLTKTGGRHRTAPPVELTGVLNETKALELMWIRLDSAKRLYQRVSYTHVCDPYVRVGDTVEAEDLINGSHTVLCEYTSHSDLQTVVEGTNYNAGVPV